MVKKITLMNKTWNIYILSLVITIAIFFLGLFIGLNIEKFVLSNLSNRASSIENAIQEIELEMLYFQGLDPEESCPFLREVVRKTNNQLDIFAEQLGGYSDKRILFTRGDVTNIKNKYTSLLIKDWILQEKIKKDCNATVVSILYFYSTEGCDDCILQGDILTLLKEKFKDRLMVFPLDVEIDNDMVEILSGGFNITSTPALVINDRKYSGIITKEPLEGLICYELPEIEQCVAK
jgi:hypothetical protein